MPGGTRRPISLSQPTTWLNQPFRARLSFPPSLSTNVPPSPPASWPPAPWPLFRPARASALSGSFGGKTAWRSGLSSLPSQNKKRGGKVRAPGELPPLVISLLFFLFTFDGNTDDSSRGLDGDACVALARGRHCRCCCGLAASQTASGGDGGSGGSAAIDLAELDGDGDATSSSSSSPFPLLPQPQGQRQHVLPPPRVHRPSALHPTGGERASEKTRRPRTRRTREADVLVELGEFEVGEVEPDPFSLPDPAAARGHHPRRQHPLGEAAGPALASGSRGGRARALPRRRMLPRLGRRAPHRLRLQL